MNWREKLGLGAALVGIVLSQVAVWPMDDPFEWPKAIATAVCFLMAFALFPPPILSGWRWPLLAPLAAFEGTFLLSILASGDWRRGLLGSEATADGLLVVALGSMVMLWVAGHSPRPDVARKVLEAFAVGATIGALYGIAQRLRIDPIPWSLDDPLYAALRNRVFGPLGNPSFLGMTLSMAAPVVVVLAAGAGRASRLWWLALVPITVALALTASRGGIIAGAIGVAMVAVLGWNLAQRRHLWLGTGVVVAAFAIGALWTQSAPSTAVSSRFLATHPDRGSTEVRLRLAEVSVAAIREKPWLGWGPGRADIAFREVGTGVLTDHQQRNPSAHNWFLDAQLQRGLPGLFVCLWLFFAVLMARRQQRAVDLRIAASAGLVAWFVGVMVGFSTVAPWIGAALLLGVLVPTSKMERPT